MTETSFDRLHPDVRRWIRDEGWSELRPVQDEAIRTILGNDRDVVIAAATAAGKTEAAFLPLLTQAAAREETGVSVLYVAPLKALINDQHRRLDLLCERMGIGLVRWHGDAPQALGLGAAMRPCFTAWSSLGFKPLSFKADLPNRILSENSSVASACPQATTINS